MTCTNSSIDYCTDCLISQMHSENSHPVTHKFVIVRGSDDMEASSSDSESTPAYSDKNEACSSGDETADLEVKREYSLSDLGLDENSGGLPDGDGQSDSDYAVSKHKNEIMDILAENPKDTSYDYLRSLIDAEFKENDIMC